MNDIKNTLRLVNPIAGIGFIICFFTLPLVSDCTGTKVFRDGFSRGASSDLWTVAILLLGVLIAVAATAFLSFTGRIRAGAASACAGVVLAIASFITSKANLSELRLGAYLDMALLVLLAAPGLFVSDADAVVPPNESRTPSLPSPVDIQPRDPGPI